MLYIPKVQYSLDNIPTVFLAVKTSDLNIPKNSFKTFWDPHRNTPIDSMLDAANKCKCDTPLLLCVGPIKFSSTFVAVFALVIDFRFAIWANIGIELIIFNGHDNLVSSLLV